MSITKLHSRRVTRELDYATTEHLIEELSIFQRQMEWSIQDMFTTLIHKKADTFSITKEKPFSHLYARMKKDEVLIRLQTSEKEIEFRIPVKQLLEI